MDDVLNPLLNPDLGALPKLDTASDAEVQQHPEERTDDVSHNEQLIGSLNHLIRILHESAETYRHAAEHVKTAWLQSLFEGYHSQREKFVTELSSLSGGLAVMPEAGSSVGEVLHQAWTDLKAAVVGVSGDEVDVLSECEESEDVTKDAYAKEILRGLPPHIHDVVQGQYQDILKAHDQVRELRDSIPH